MENPRENFAAPVQMNPAIHAERPRQLPTKHGHAVPTRAYQSDSSSKPPARCAAPISLFLCEVAKADSPQEKARTKARLM